MGINKQVLPSADWVISHYQKVCCHLVNVF